MGYTIYLMERMADKAGIKIEPVIGVSGVRLGYMLTKGKVSQKFRSSDAAVAFMKKLVKSDG